MRRIQAVVGLALCALAGCVSPPAPTEQPDEMTLTGARVELPTAFFKGKPHVALKVNGTGPYWFLVDTGADGLCVTPQLVREARIPASGFSNRITGAAGSEQLPVVTVARLEADSLSLRGVGATVLGPRLSGLLERGVEGKFGGLLGMSVLQNLPLEIDYPLHQVSLEPIGSRELPAAEGIPYDGIRPHITMATPSPAHPTITALLDTGSGEDFILADIASYPTRVGLAKSDTYHVGAGGSWRALFGQLDGDIRLGPAIWRNPKIYEGQSTGIGSPALAPWKLVINPVEKKLWLLNGKLTSTTQWTGPLDPDGRPAVYGFVSMPDGDAFVVKEVDPGSRAERAGLKVGDRYRSEKPAGQDNANSRRLRVVRGAEELFITMSLAIP